MPNEMSIGMPTCGTRRLADMEQWAKRIQQRLDELRDSGLTESGLARACKISRASVSGWFGKGTKVTKMISGDNLVAAADYLLTTPHWIMTGRGGHGVESQSAGLAPKKIVSTTKALLTFLRRRDQGATLDLTDLQDAELFAGVYAEAIALPATPSEDEQTEFAAKVADLIAAREARHERVRSQSVGGDSRKEAGKQVSGAKA